MSVKKNANIDICCYNRTFSEYSLVTSQFMFRVLQKVVIIDIGSSSIRAGILGERRELHLHATLIMFESTPFLKIFVLQLFYEVSVIQ